MAVNTTQFREAIKPQDTVAVVITLMGIAIAIFLSDAIIKLIGASIAVLGLVALYVTIKQRINDQVHLRSRRTTLPPPAFKTRVTQDPSSSTKRILFDDFQETFAPADDDPPVDDAYDADEGFSLARTIPTPDTPATGRPAQRPATSVPGGGDEAVRPTRSATGLAGISRDAVESGATFNDVGGESFRVVRPVNTGGERTSASEPSPTGSSATGAAAAGSSAAEPPTGDDARDAAPNPDTAPLDDAPGLRTIPLGSAEPTPLDAIAPAEASRVSVPPMDVPMLEPPARDAVRHEPRGTARPEPTRRPPEVPAQDEVRTPTRKQAQFIVEDLVSDGDEDPRGGEPRGEFVRLVGQVLNAIARSIQARSIVFFWVNFEKWHLIPEAKVTTGRYEIRTGARIRLGNDVISQIARSGVPEVITDISPAAERELIAYYAGPADTRSFVGVPVFFRREVVGVLAADSIDDSGFDEVSVATLAEYTRLISGLIRSYTEKYDLHLIARTLDAFERMSQDFSGAAPDPVHTAGMLAHQVADLFDTGYVSVVLFDEADREWKVSAWHSESAERDLTGLRPDMRISLVGKATRNAQEVLVERVAGDVRFAPGEPLEQGGTFLAVPLVATTKCYGALAVEHPSPEAYIPRDIELMRDLANYAAMAIEVFNTNRAIESHVVLDEVTGLFNTEYLLHALDREIARARDFKEKLSFALISIDMPASLRAENSPELEEIIAGSVGSVIESTVRPYDIVGRYDPKCFGVVLAKRGDQDAYIWAEKLRKEVASSILALGDRKSAVTISVGISDLGDHVSRDAMINGAQLALEKARGGEGNAVILY